MSDHFGNNREDGYVSKAYVYAPTWERLIDRDPDHRSSDGLLACDAIGPKGRDFIWAFEVRGLGAFVARSHGSDPDTGRLDVGFSIFTEDELKFDR